MILEGELTTEPSAVILKDQFLNLFLLRFFGHGRGASRRETEEEQRPDAGHATEAEDNCQGLVEGLAVDGMHAAIFIGQFTLEHLIH